jgi:hypothetical protein
MSNKILDNPGWNAATRAATTIVALQLQADETAHAAKLAREREAERQKRDIENAKMAESFRIQDEKEKRVAEKKLRETESANLDSTLRERFFGATPFATESDFQRVKDSLRDEYLLERMRGQKTTEQLFAQTSVKM